MLRERVRTGAIALRNVLLGANAASAVLARSPAGLVSYATHAICLLDSIRQNRGLPERNILDVLPGAPPAAPITLGGSLAFPIVP